MKQLLSLMAVLVLGALTLLAQQTPSTQSPSAQPPDTTAQQPVDTQGQGAAQSFEGKITKLGNKLVLKDVATQASYQLDDQDKAKMYEGKNVKVIATMDTNTNTLHVVDITPAER